eukprot:CAMPEP_0172519992 /NCGR_PEP_ID=MMETSP1066-20121228/291738_1 /TAXON_ID=671091 /ORGANISM="Coscinodiscus wailesii, Strain CCMP2513" /LENGTH=423 /DNA_ID=CAMNT_0013302671 /DNA_START=95 /DNA_END=1366 /DNA_ORIENTATION=+
MPGANRAKLATTLNNEVTNGASHIPTRPRSVTKYWHSNSKDDSSLQRHPPMNPRKMVHRRGYSTPDVFFRSSKGLPTTPPRVIIDPKTHRRIVSPLQLAPKPPQIAPPTDSSLSPEDELDELHSTLCTARNLYGSNHVRVALAHNGIGNFHFRHGNFPLAKDSYVTALNVYKSLVGQDHVFVAITLGNIGTLYWRLGDFERAESDLEESLRIHRLCVDGTDDNAEVAAALHNLGIVRFLMKNYEGAVGVLARAHKARRNLFGSDNIDVSRSIDALGSVYLMLGDEVKAMTCHREALRVKQVLLGHCHPSLVATIMNIAKVYRMQGDLARAVVGYEEAFEMQKAIYPEWDRLEDVGVTIHTVGFTYMLKRDYQKAIDAYEQTAAIYKAAGLSSDDKRVIALNESKSKIEIVVAGAGRKYMKQTM